MAVKDESLYHATQNLILATPRKYYHQNIYTSHWQLRSLVSSPEQDIVYYPHGKDVIALNTKTRVRKIIFTLPFNPRCLTASKDWVCCGGEHGKFTAISLKQSALGRASTGQDVDTRLPMELDTVRRSSTRDTPTNSARSHSPPRVNNSTAGTEIVNSATIWYPGTDRAIDAFTIPVAVVANNDRTISFLDLEDLKMLEKLTLPDYVNRSVMSPDGSILASICDDPYLYIHERKPKPKSEVGTLDSRLRQNYEWVLSGKFQLQGQKVSDVSDLRGSFAACFSPSGKYLAVATQYGIISIFETISLKGPISLPLVFTTSRPGPEVGAVRAMEFCKGPYDLLAWTESHGRFCVADVRDLFLSRQLIKISPKADGVEQVITRDEEADRDHATVHTPRNVSRSSSSAPNVLAIETERRQIRHLTRVILDRYDPPPFSPAEIEVLHASQAARRQRDGAASGDANTIEEAGSSSSLLSTSNEPPRSNVFPDFTYGNLTRYDRQTSTTGLPPVLREFMMSDRTASFRSFINERNRETERRSLRPQEPRRRESMMLPAAENVTEREVARDSIGVPQGEMATNENEAATNFERLTLTQPRMTGPGSPSNPWADIDALYRSRYLAELPRDRSARLRVEVEDQQRMPRRAGVVEPEGAIEANIESTGRDESPSLAHPGETMGCCWSPDGKILYIAAGEGIYEYRVNTDSRKMFPSLVMR